MAARRRTPRWLARVVVDAVHADQLREHGGLQGVHDENALESALARPQQKWAYDGDTDLAVCAAAYAYGLARNHPYRDGNKRIAFLAMATLVGINGYTFDATDEDVVTQFLDLAAGRVAEEELSNWIRRRMQKTRSGR